MYCTHMMYKYYSHIGFSLIKHNKEGKDIHNEIFNNIPYFIQKCPQVDFIQDGFVMYKNKVIIFKIEVINPSLGSIIPEDFSQENSSVIHFTTDDMTSKFDFFQITK